MEKCLKVSGELRHQVFKNCGVVGIWNSDKLEFSLDMQKIMEKLPKYHHAKDVDIDGVMDYDLRVLVCWRVFK
jgi:hypothetical protein